MKNLKITSIKNTVMLKFNVKNSKTEKGITLIALVITIIVLLILAGVSISLTIGNNGILTQASNTVLTNDEAKIKEEISMAASRWSSENYVSNVIEGKKSDTAFENFKESLPTNFTTAENADGTLLVSGEYKGIQYKYFVLEDGNVVSDKLIERVKQGDYINYSSQSLSGGENWRVLYTENNRIYLVSTNPTEIVQAINNNVEETEESVKNFVSLLNSERTSSVTVKIGRDKTKFPDENIQEVELNYLSELSDKYQLTLTLEQVSKALGIDIEIGNQYNYDYFHNVDTNNLFNTSADCYYFGTYYGNLGTTTQKNCIYMWWSNSGGAGPCWALQSAFDPGTKIRPVVQLKENIKVISGNGSLEYPYEIEM